MKNYVLTCMILLVFNGFLNAQQIDFDKYGIDSSANIPEGLAVGVKAPLIKGTSIDGENVELTEILKSKKVVLIFYRGVWCPVCIRYLSNLQDSLQIIESNNAVVIAVTPEVAANADKTKSKTDAGFIILSDSSERIMRDYKVWFEVTSFYQTKVRVGRLDDIAANNGQETARLPVPATFVIDQNGIIRYRQFDLNYKNRASVKEIVEALKKIE